MSKSRSKLLLSFVVSYDRHAGEAHENGTIWLSDHMGILKEEH